MNEKNIFERLDSIGDLPTLSAVYGRMCTILGDMNASAEDIAKELEKDPAITAKLLRLVNSSFYGFQHRICSVSQAVVVLGFNMVRNLVLAVSIFDKFGTGKGHETGDFDRPAFWVHSIGCAVAAHEVSQYIAPHYQEECFVGGLLHDIGKLVSDTYLHQEFRTACQLARKNNISLLEAERMTFGITHATVGGYIAQRWNFPPALLEAVSHHHAPSSVEGGARNVVFCVHIADALVRALDVGFGGDPFVPEISEMVLQEIDITPDSLKDWIPAIDARAERSLSIFEIMRES
jgi:putative nucleotidyltransferase with HDIG domain